MRGFLAKVIVTLAHTISPFSSYRFWSKNYILAEEKKTEKVNRWKVRARHDHKWLLHLSNWGEKSREKTRKFDCIGDVSLQRHINNTQIHFSRSLAVCRILYLYLIIYDFCMCVPNLFRRQTTRIKTRYMGFIENFMTVALCVSGSASVMYVFYA